jgi:hypothetical protein
MNRGLCIAKLFTAMVIASAMHPPEASAQSCVSQGPRYLLTSDTVYWHVQLASGKSCVRGLRFSNVLLEKVSLIDSPKSGKVDLVGPGFRYTANPGFHGEDSFSVGVLRTANKTRGSSTIRVAVAVIDIHARSPAPTSRPTPIPMGPLLSIFNCSSGFAASGPCGVSFPSGGGSQPFMVIGATNGSVPALVGSQVNLVPAGAVHNANNLNWLRAVNVQQFSTTFTYVPNGWNIALVLTNNDNASSSGVGSQFSAGAGCEGSFFQGFGGTGPPHNTFALELDQYSSLVGGGSTFTYSSVQHYNTGVYASPVGPATRRTTCFGF